MINYPSPTTYPAAVGTTFANFATSSFNNNPVILYALIREKVTVLM